MKIYHLIRAAQTAAHLPLKGKAVEMSAENKSGRPMVASTSGIEVKSKIYHSVFGTIRVYHIKCKETNSG